MLVLSRRIGEKIVIDDNITLTVVRIQGDKVRLGIEADRSIPVHRSEVLERIRRMEAEQANQPVTPDPAGDGQRSAPVKSARRTS